MAMAACDQTSPLGDFKRDLEAIVDNIVPAGLLALQSVSITEMRRAEEAGHGGRTVRFVALAKLNRAIDFSAWDQFSIAALANAFGTRPESIGGIALRGNA